MCGRPNDVRAFIITARGAAPVTGDRPHPDRPNEHAPNVTRELHVEPLCFDMIAPLPDDYSRNPYGHPDGSKKQGIDMQRDAWGVKWGPYKLDDDREDGDNRDVLDRIPVVSDGGQVATYPFTCAWSAPIVAIERASVRYRMLSFFLSWGGEGPTRGRVMISDGATTEVIPEESGGDDFPTSAEWDAVEGNDDAEEALHRRSQAAESKYLTSHDEWVATTWRATEAARVLYTRLAGS